MSWIAKSIANSLKLDDDEERRSDDFKIDVARHPNAEPDWNNEDSQSPLQSQSSPSSRANTPRGVKEDLSELTKSLSRQFWGVASFLAPPPIPPDQMEKNQPSYQAVKDHPSEQTEIDRASDQKEKSRPSDPEESEEDLIAGIRSDFAEIGGRFRTGISKLSGNIAVSEITKMASNFLQLGSDEEGSNKYEIVNAIGVTEEVIAFARDITMHPGTWLDFPLPDEDDFDNFDMSDAQQEHALAVESLAPRLAALRIELCPEYMSEACFWKIYFVLLHPILNKHDALVLSTPEVLEARAMLSHELQRRNRAMVQPNNSGSHSEEVINVPREESLSVPCDPSDAVSESAPFKSISTEVKPASDSYETVKHSIQSTEAQVIDKSVVDVKQGIQSKQQNTSTDSSRVLDIKFDDDGDDWLKDEASETTDVGGNKMPLGDDEDVSFSDLEDDDDGDVPISYKKGTSGSDSSSKDSRDWVQLGAKDYVKDVKAVNENRASSVQVTACPSNARESNDWLDVEDIDVM